MSFYNPPYKLRNWVSLEKLDWGSLSRNLNGIELLLENYDKIVWDDLSRNENAIDILKENMEKIDWDQTTSKSICQNKNAIGIIKSNLHKVTDWYNLSKNESAIELLENDKNQISWFCPYWDECIYDIDGINFLKDKFSKEKLFCWWNLENNPMAIAFLKENLDKVNWDNLSKNKWAIDIIKGNLDKIDDWYVNILGDSFLKKNNATSLIKNLTLPTTPCLKTYIFLMGFDTISFTTSNPEDCSKNLIVVGL